MQRVEASENGIGFFGYAYYQENKGELKAIAVYNEDAGKCVKPTAKTIQNGSYPISRPLFIYPDNAKLTSGSAREGLLRLLHDEKTLTETVQQAGYVPLAKADRQATITAYKGISDHAEHERDRPDPAPAAARC